ncbi:MAG: hypothetical protein NUW21_06780, partial [Elusimicrobia bacterium]|nr:hypothetical protein [Elusimicrobiota bacterium]
RASADVGESLYLAPRARFYRSDSSGGTFVLIGLRLGWEEGPWSLGVEGAVQPKVAGYEKSAFGADALYTFPRDHLEVDAGGAVLAVRHEDEFAAAIPAPASGPGSGARRLVSARPEALVVLQADVSALTALRWPVAELSAEATKSLYDRDLDAANARESQFLELGGVDPVVQGFPDTNVNVRFEWKALARLRPHASWSHTTFKLGASPSNGYEGGARLRLDRISLKAAYQRYVQKGWSGRDYFTVGASLTF